MTQDVISSCIFCKIIAGILPATIIAHNDSVLVIKDIAPKAPIHYLILPKKHMHDFNALDIPNDGLIVPLFEMAQQLSAQLGHNNAYKLVINNGAAAGQMVFHLHIHFLSGSAVPALMDDTF